VDKREKRGNGPLTKPEGKDAQIVKRVRRGAETMECRDGHKGAGSDQPKAGVGYSKGKGTAVDITTPQIPESNEKKKKKKKTGCRGAGWGMFTDGRPKKRQPGTELTPCGGKCYGG